jgi:thiol-disulfide isomerase/thioredoxin
MRDEDRHVRAMAATCAMVAAVVLGSCLGVPDGWAEDTVIPVTLEPGVAGSAPAPRYSPKGFRVKLSASDREIDGGIDVLEGRLLLGPNDTRADGHLLLLARSESEKPYDLLLLDTNGDGSLEGEQLRRATPRLSRSSIYTSYDAILEVNHGSAAEPLPEAYPVGLWVAVDSERATPPFIRFSRRGFLSGTVALDGVSFYVVLSDANNDAVYGSGDWWALLPVEGGEANVATSSRKVGDFAWAGRRAFRFDLEGTNGRRGRLTAIDPGLTPEEDARARDPYWDDKQAERADAPVAFRRDVDAALTEARESEALVFLDFETTWCGPCKTMDRLVYTAKAVVAGAEGIFCVKVDGDEHPELKDKYEVTAFPTGILLDTDGHEIARFKGYLSVKEMVAFLAKARERGEPE